MNFNIEYLGKHNGSYTLWNVNGLEILFRGIPKIKKDDVKKALEILSENLRKKLPIHDAIKLLPYPQLNILILIKHFFTIDFLQYIESYLSKSDYTLSMYDFYIKELGFDTNERGMISTLTISNELSEFNSIVCGWITNKVEYLNILKHLNEGNSTAHISDTIGVINFFKILCCNYKDYLTEYIDMYFQKEFENRNLPVLSEWSRFLINEKSLPDKTKLNKEEQEFVIFLKTQFNSIRPIYGYKLIENNINEMNINKDIWKVYALGIYNDFASKTIDFSGIKGEKFKKEIKWFFKDDVLNYIIQRKDIQHVAKSLKLCTEIVNYLYSDFNVDGFAQVDDFLAQLVKRFLMFEACDEKTGENIKPRTMSRVVTEIRKIVDYMIENKSSTINHPIPATNIFNRVKFYNTTNMSDTMDVIPDIVLDKLEENIKHLDITYQRIFNIFLGTGMRAKEVLFLEKDCLDYSCINNSDVNKRGIILRYTPYKVLISQKKKCMEKHEIYIQKELADIIEEQIRETECIREKYNDVPYIFIKDVCEQLKYQGRNFTSNINKLIKECNICDIDGILWVFDSRQMRATVASNMIENGAYENEIMTTLNHIDINTTRKYYEKARKLKLADLNQEFFKKQFELEVGTENLEAFDEEERKILAYEFATKIREVEFGQCVKHDSEGKCKRAGEYACANCNKICTGKQYLPKWESLLKSQSDIVASLETEYQNTGISKDEYSNYIEYIREVNQLNYYQDVINRLRR